MADPAMPADDAAAGGDSEDLTQGYVIEISCLPDGTYKVSGPEPLQEEAQEEQGETPDADDKGEDFDSIGAALKGVLQMIKDNPMGDNAQSQFEAGYASR